jgi:hypothetical protein
MGTEAVESEHVCIPLDGSGGAGFPSSPICGGGIERVFSGGRDVLGLRKHSMSAETMQWLMLNEKK